MSHWKKCRLLKIKDFVRNKTGLKLFTTTIYFFSLSIVSKEHNLSGLKPYVIHTFVFWIPVIFIKITIIYILQSIYAILHFFCTENGGTWWNNTVYLICFSRHRIYHHHDYSRRKFINSWSRGSLDSRSMESSVWFSM